METVAQLVEGLRNKDNTYAYECLKRLMDLSAVSGEAYPFFPVFTEMLRSEHSYVRTRGVLMIAEVARWDADNRVDEIIDEYLKHLQDPKPIAARQSIRCVRKVAEAKPDLRDDIAAALMRVNLFRYPGTMRTLIAGDITEALRDVREMETAGARP